MTTRQNVIIGNYVKSKKIPYLVLTKTTNYCPRYNLQGLSCAYFPLKGLEQNFLYPSFFFEFLFHMKYLVKPSGKSQLTFNYEDFEKKG